MAPPELARDAPVVDVLHPVEVGLLVLLGREADGFVAVGVGLDGGDGLLGERLNLDEPLRGEARLDDGLQRSQWPMLLVWSLTAPSRPCASRSATMRLRAT
jgi:hypothetical protein